METLDILLLAKISSIHVFPSGRAIIKYPLDETENKAVSVSPDMIEMIKSSGNWRIVNADGVFHAIRNPDGAIKFEIPEGLDLSGKSVVFGITGAGKSTLLSCVGKEAVEQNKNVFTIESPKSLCVADATHLENNEDAINTVLLCRPDLILFDEIRDSRHYKQLKQLALACPQLIGSFHATEIFEALARFSAFNGDRSYGELSTIVDRFIHVDKGKIVNWYTLRTTLSSHLSGEFYCDGERPVTEIRDRHNNIVGWLFYFANDINIVKNESAVNEDYVVEEEVRT
jgi:predicted PilT family ATPase